MDRDPTIEADIDSRRLPQSRQLHYQPNIRFSQHRIVLKQRRNFDESGRDRLLG